MSVSLWQSELLGSVPHGVTRRTGGVSDRPALESLNLSLRVGDDASAVAENRRRLAHSVGYDAASMICAEQVHGSIVAVVSRDDRGRGVADHADAIPGADALVTTDPDILLTLFFADCYPLLIADRHRRVVAIAHAGWRGAVGGVVENTIAAMLDVEGIDAADLVAAIGPGIGACCFEVGPEVAAHFDGSVVSPPTEAAKAHVDLRVVIRTRLICSGVSPENIDTCPDCTACRPDIYFSHRRDRGRTGRMAGVIGIGS